ncbi:DUF2285 domain-containing protein [Sandaracinobacter neustonicus]|uniref:DUF2285 domain-containing protein n=2 Tax=Sandaracinobacter neustonicus TaxID=1715348 RepID=A0A501XJW6_9SPHN|nr:DUF2285 domain-containing protein [Sandaracinobacter neustonicus]
MVESSPVTLDEPPAAEAITAYDHAHLTLYLQLLDFAQCGGDWQQGVREIFEADPTIDPERSRHVYEAHLARARWISEKGYRGLVSGS